MAERKRILYVITESVWGGAQRYVYDLATRLPHDRFRVAVACGGTGPLIGRLQAAGIAVLPLPGLERRISPNRELASFFALLRLFIRERPEIIHLSSSKVGGLGAVAAWLASLITGCRATVIFTVHGWAFAEDRPVWQRLLIFLASWLSTRFHDLVILVNRADARRARRFVPAGKLAFVPHGIRPIAPLAARDARAELARLVGHPLDTGTPLIGTVAELTENKGLRYLVEALDRLRARSPSEPLRAIVIGDGEGRGALERRIAALGIGNRVSLAGFIPDAARYLRAFDLFALPSLKEGLPYVIIEAMAAGVPVIATAVGGLPDLIEDGRTGRLVPAKDPGALADAITDLLRDRERRSSMAARARRKVADDFSFEPMLKRTLALYSAGES